jgi:hypothetical protein
MASMPSRLQLAQTNKPIFYLSQANFSSFPWDTLLLYGFSDMPFGDGAAGVIDWIACGRLRAILQRCAFQGHLKEKLFYFMHIGRWPVRILFIGAGPWKKSTLAQTAELLSWTHRTLVNAGLSEKHAVVVPCVREYPKMERVFLELFCEKFSQRFHHILHVEAP